MAESETGTKPAAKKRAAKKPATKKAAGGSSGGNSAPASDADSAVKDKIRESLMGLQGDTPSASSSASRATAAPAFEHEWEPPSEIRLGAKKADPKEVSNFLRQLSTLQSAGLPLLRSLKLLERRANNPEFRSTLGTIVGDLERGTQLWQALSKHPDYFNRMVVNVIHTGEESGSLVTVMDYLARYRDHEDDVRRNVEQAVLYPLIMLVLAIAVMVVLLVTVIPQFAESYEALGAELPFVTQVLFGASDAMKYFFLAFFAVVLFMFWVNRQSMSGGGIRSTIDRVKIKIPIFGSIMTKVYVVQFSTMLSILLKSGLPMLRALDLVRETVNNVVWQDAFAYVRDNVERGRTLEESFQSLEIFPPMVQDMVAVGEESGSLPEVLDQVAVTFQKEVDHESAQVGKILEPMLLVVLGGFVLFIAMSLFLPYFNLMPNLD